MVQKGGKEVVKNHTTKTAILCSDKIRKFYDLYLEREKL